jgi:polysaccharide deacetylase family protein (PEP-CTERM system associated)
MSGVGVRPVTNALSIDVEEYYHATVFEEAVGGATAGLESRVEFSTERVLALLGDAGVKATFFILGEVAEAHPDLVRRIAAGGHEIACHDFHHTMVFARTPEAFRKDIRRAKAVLEDLGGQPVAGYRAPSFSIGPAERWAYEILVEEGFQYDSSVYPIVHDRYGDRVAPRFPYEIWRSGHRGLIEFPIGTLRWFGVNLPIGGGGYFRLLPGGVISAGIRRVNTQEHGPAMFYFHPWELDPGHPRPAMAWHRRFRLYVGQRGHEAKLTRLLASVPFGTAREILRRSGMLAPEDLASRRVGAGPGPLEPHRNGATS